MSGTRTSSPRRRYCTAPHRRTSSTRSHALTAQLATALSHRHRRCQRMLLLMLRTHPNLTVPRLGVVARNGTVNVLQMPEHQRNSKLPSGHTLKLRSADVHRRGMEGEAWQGTAARTSHTRAQSEKERARAPRKRDFCAREEERSVQLQARGTPSGITITASKAWASAAAGLWHPHLHGSHAEHRCRRRRVGDVREAHPWDVPARVLRSKAGGVERRHRAILHTV